MAGRAALREVRRLLQCPDRNPAPLACSNIPLRKWAIAVHLCLTSLESVSSIQLHRDLNVSQKTAWFMLHRIREAWMP